jgi:hypothetical protein
MNSKESRRQMKSDPRNAFVAFRASCWTRLIRDFVTGREHFALTFDKAEELNEMVDVLAWYVHDITPQRRK